MIKLSLLSLGLWNWFKGRILKFVVLAKEALEYYKQIGHPGENSKGQNADSNTDDKGWGGEPLEHVLEAIYVTFC